MLTETVKNEIERIVGRGNASFSKEYALCYSYDATNNRFFPEGVVFPADAEEVSLILKMANSEGFCVVPRGAGSGFTGGSLPVEGGVVLSTERMNRIVEMDTENLMAVVEPGVVTGHLQEEAERLGLFYPPDPTSAKFSTIGGNIAECAGGPRAVKYGVTRDYVLGLEVVLPTGEIINTGTRTVKGVAGYDLTRLFAGSEGTLGVVTKAALRLLPLPEARRTILALFPALEDAARAASGIISSGVIPSVLELVDSSCLKCVEEYAGIRYPGVEALLLIEVDGRRTAVEEEAGEVERICSQKGASTVKTAMERKEVKELWKARRAISPALFKLKPFKINEDVVVPRSRIPDLLTGIREIAERRNIVIACFGHAGDGNIHANVMIDRKDPREAEEGEGAVRDIFELTIKLGGTITGEHGVGITKAPYLSMELDKVTIDVMRRIKKVLDPKYILNRGKIFGRGEDARESMQYSCDEETFRL